MNSDYQRRREEGREEVKERERERERRREGRREREEGERERKRIVFLVVFLSFDFVFLLLIETRGDTIHREEAAHAPSNIHVVASEN